MLELIYSSAAVKPFSDTELTTLLQKARHRNAPQGITGMLLYDAGSFLQVLEGEAAPLQALYAKIEADPRHTRIIKLLESTITTRSFENWSMGFASTDHLRAANLPGYSELLGRGFSPERFLPGNERAKARQILLAFREGRWRTYVGS